MVLRRRPRRAAVASLVLVAALSGGGAVTRVASAQERSAKRLATTEGARRGPGLPPIIERIALVADLDDDDGDGRADGRADFVANGARVDLVTLATRFAGATLSPVRGAEHVRLVAQGRPAPWGARVGPGAQLQGLSPGRADLVARWASGREEGVAVDVHGVTLRDGERRRVDMATERASLQRTPPARVDLDQVDRAYADPDALRVVVSSPEGAPLGPITLESLSAEGAPLDATGALALRPAACDPPSSGLTCFASAPIRFVGDDVDRHHPLVSARSVKAEVGGAVIVRDAKGKKLQAVRVAGPRRSPVGPIDRHRVALRPIVMRLTKDGAPAVGGTDAGALAIMREELATAAAIWGQCGISFGPVAEIDVKIVSPPPPYLVALGDDVGLPASGGEVRLRVEGRGVTLRTKRGWSTRQAALELQRVAEAAGLRASVSENARIGAGASPSVDVALRRRDGQLASAELVSSTEATMSVRVGAVDLSDGLQHFGDTDSVAGTFEERALIKAVDDGDPQTIEIIVVPFFGGGSRIGESFIGSDGSSLRNVVLIDRAGVRARRASLTLAHELGHVILDEPGHPDDYGADTPTRLMDSDAADASPFGPRRLTVDDCARAVRQSGPGARIPLLTEWALTPLDDAR